MALRCIAAICDLRLSKTVVDQVLNEFGPVHNRIIANALLLVKRHRDCLSYHNNDMKTVAARLKACREEIGLTQAELAKKARLKGQSIIGSLESGHRKTSSHIPAIAEALGVEPLWLADGRGPKRTVRVSPETEPPIPMLGTKIRVAKTGDSIEIQQYDTGGAMGKGILLRDQPGIIQSWKVSREWLNKNVKTHSGAQNLCIVTGFGDSMRPMFNPGDPLLVDRGVTSVDFDAVYFFRVGNEGFLKRLQKIPGEGLRVISTNKEYESWTIRHDMDFEVFGRVLKVWRSEDF